VSAYKHKSISRSRKTFVGVLFVGSAAALWLPREWTGRLMNLVQWVLPFQEAARVVVDASMSTPPPTAVSTEDYEVLARTNAALEHRTAALASRIDELEAEVRTLTATRLWDAGGRRLGSRGRLIPAQVVGEDLLAWRSSRLLSAGTWHGVSDGAAVVSRVFTIDHGDGAEVQTGLAILLGESLVGFIEESGTHVSQVRLLTDVTTQMKVRIGRLGGGGFVLLDGYFWLTGVGDGKLRIRDVDHRLVDTGHVQVGDRVLSDPQNEVLPAALTIGRVAEIVPDRDNPLFNVLTVESSVAENGLRRVFIYDPKPDAP